MAFAPRDLARDALQRVLFAPVVNRARPVITRAVRRIHNHLHNCSTNPRANGENWLITQLPSSGTFLDVGFNQGSWTRAVLAQSPGAMVHGFDPCRGVVASVERLDLPRDRFRFHPIALSHEPGSARFFDYGNLHEMNSLTSRAYELSEQQPETYEVLVSTLDACVADLGDPLVDVLKVDAEGYDLHILEGARSLLERQRIDLIVFEYGSGWFASKRTLFEANRFLSGAGYALHRLFPHFLAPYQYRVDHEGTLTGYFVALSEKMNVRPFPKRNIFL